MFERYSLIILLFKDTIFYSLLFSYHHLVWLALIGIKVNTMFLLLLVNTLSKLTWNPNTWTQERLFYYIHNNSQPPLVIGEMKSILLWQSIHPQVLHQPMCHHLMFKQEEVIYLCLIVKAWVLLLQDPTLNQQWFHIATINLQIQTCRIVLSPPFLYLGSMNLWAKMPKI